MPRWHSEKSYFTGSPGSSARSDVGDLPGHRPPGADVARQPKAASHPDDVRVERHDERRRRHGCPHAEIERVAAHHPSQEQVQALARGARGRPRERNNRPRATGFDRPLRRHDRQRPPGKAVESGADVGRAGLVAFGEETLDRSRAIEHPPQDPDERDEIVRSDPPVHRGPRSRPPAAPRTIARTQRGAARGSRAGARSTAARSQRGRTRAPPRRIRRFRGRRRARSA